MGDFFDNTVLFASKHIERVFGVKPKILLGQKKWLYTDDSGIQCTETPPADLIRMMSGQKCLLRGPLKEVASLLSGMSTCTLGRSGPRVNLIGTSSSQ